MWSRIWVARGGAAVATGLSGGGLYAYDRAKKEMGDDALERMISHERVAVPAIIEYKLCELRNEKLPAAYAAELEALHRKWAPVMYDKFMELGGFYYKSGQKIAANQGGVVPEYYIELFQPFLNAIPARDFDKVRAVVVAELGGAPLESVFSSFDPEPIGCASIGQAHRARLRSNGARVVVKVQNPEAERTFVGDVFALRVLVANFFPQMVPAFDEIQRQFATEFDYRGEAENAAEIRANLKRAGRAFENVIVPRVYPELCTRRLLVMDEISPSVPLHHALDRLAGALAKRQGISKRAYMDACAEEIRRDAAHGVVPEPLSDAAYARFIRLQKVRRSLDRAGARLYNATLGPWRGAYDVDDVFIPINAARLVDDLFRVHGHEVLVDGCFNADPHPGNILYVDGHLGLIDYGQVKRITKAERVALAKVLVLVGSAMGLDPRTDPDADPKAHARAKASVATCMRQLGGKMTKNDPDVAYEMGTVYFGRCDAAWLWPRNLIQFADEMQSRDPLESLDDVEYFVMTCQVTLMLRGLAEVLRQPRNLAEVWKPLARQVLRDNGLLDEVDEEIDSWTRPP